MTNLKKTLAVVLTFAMVFSMGIINTFAAYSDVAEGTVTAEAVGILSNLGIFTGFEDGTFKPDDTVTRAQMAAIICRTLGYEDQAQSSTGSTVFTDVAGDHWASGYINVAQAQGIINGFPDGSFQPEAQVTYEQAVKMIVSALGYDLVAEAKGGYPSGYLAIASSEAITKNANGKVGDAAKRGTIAILVYNSLEVRLMDQTTWTTNGEDEFGKTAETILSKYLEVVRVEGVIEEIPFNSYVSGYNKDNTPQLRINGNKYYYAEVGKVVTEQKEAYAETVDCSLVDAGSLLGKTAVAYIGKEADAETGNVMVYAISEKQNKNKVVSISSTDLVENGDRGYNVAGQISYTVPGSTRIEDLELAASPKVFVNFATERSAINTTQDLAGFLPAGGMVELISNDNDEKIDYIIITAFQNEAVIEEVTDEDGVLVYDCYYGSLDEIDTENEDALVVVYKDGALAAPADLAANDTVSVVQVSRYVTVLYASSTTVTGAVTSYYDDTVTIGGVDYQVGQQYYTGTGADPSQLADKEGIFFINVGGFVAHAEADSTAAGNYGMALAVVYESGISDGYVMQVVMQDGTVADYDLASKVTYTLADGRTNLTATAPLGKDDVAAARVASAITGTTVTAAAAGFGKCELQSQYAEDAMFKFTIKNGEITKIKEVENTTTVNEYAVGNNKKYDAEAMTYGAYEFDENTIIFALDDVKGTAVVADDAVAVGAPSSFMVNEDDGLALIFFTEKNKKTVTFAIGFDLKASVPEDSAAVIVTAVKSVTYNDDEAVEIVGIQAGEEVSYIIYEESGSYSNGANPASIGKGDVVLVSTPSAENVVEDFKVLVSANANARTFTLMNGAQYGDTSDDIYNTVATLTSAVGSKFFISSDIQNFTVTGGTPALNATWAQAADGIVMKANANYTLVDYTEGTRNPIIEKKTPSTSLFNTTKYDSQVFVRVYDDALAEVVVYRFEKGTAQTPVIAVANGDVTIDCSTPGATIKVSIDGGAYANYDATAVEQLAEGAIVKAYATAAGMFDSAEASHTVLAAEAYVAPAPAPGGAGGGAGAGE